MFATGVHTLSFVFGGDKPHSADYPQQSGRFAAIDCLVLAPGPFTPSGFRKPGEPIPPVHQDIPPGAGWDFKPTPDALSSDAVLDLRYLNEKTAGEHGFIRLGPGGSGFVRGDGVPIRFWATNEMVDTSMDELKQHAQFLAKRGINMIRLHTSICSQEAGSRLTDVNEAIIDRIFRTVAAMRSAGIYTMISPLYPDCTTVLKDWGDPLCEGGRASGLLYFDPTLQLGYRAWMKQLYTRVNPYTNLRLADDPAVAIIQFQNETGLLWWSTCGYPPTTAAYLRNLYAKFLVAKYGSLEKARAAWKDYNPPAGEITVPSEWDKGLPGMPHIWDLTRDGMAKKGGWPGFRECAGDYAEFLMRTMHEFNANLASYLRTELGCKQMMNSDNWRGPDGLTQDGEYWSQAGLEVVAKNSYAGGYHIGINSGWQVLVDGYYTNMSMIKNPLSLPFNFKHPLGHAAMIPETTWVHPDLYQSEAPLLMAAQSCLTGFDIGFWFCSDALAWTDNAVTKWSDNTPMLLGQFPAAALIFRTALVQAGSPALVEHRPLKDVFQRTTPLIYDEIGWDDPNHSAGVTLDGKATAQVDQLAFLVGPVQVELGSDQAGSQVADLAKYINRAKSTVSSITGQIFTDYGNGVYRVDAPKVQAAAGFLGSAGTQKLADVAITCKNAYATVIVVALDDQPLRSSDKVLVQVGTICRPKGWTTRPATVFPDRKPLACERIVTVGTMPWQIEKNAITLTLANPQLDRATLLDMNGVPDPTPVSASIQNGSITVQLPGER